VNCCIMNVGEPKGVIPMLPEIIVEIIVGLLVIDLFWWLRR